MNIAEPFIRRPVMTTLIMTAVLLSGVVAYNKLPVSDLPNVDYPTISVSASLPGASPETMASAVATPLEKEFSTIAGIDAMTSVSQQGATSITIQFSLDRDIDAAAQDVQRSISSAQRSLPLDIRPPTLRKVDPSAQPILYYALTSKTLPLSALDEYAETTLSQKISTLEGVAQVQIYGSQKYAVRVQLDPQALAARRIGLDQVVDAINAGNVNLPTGILWGTDQAYSVMSDGQLNDAAQFRPLVVAWRNGAPVRLGDLGQVLDGVEDTKRASWFNGTKAIIMAIQRQPGANTVAVARRVKETIAGMQGQLPGSVEIKTLSDRSVSIERSVSDVRFTLGLTLVLVILVIFLFLRNLTATLIPSLALPMSLIGTFAVMYKLGYSLDNLSLMALTLAVGFVVDDAIVVLENIVRHMEMGKPAFQAALDGSQEISFTVVSMTVSLVAVFIPLLFLGGIIGRLFAEFAVTISVAILVSGFVSLTLTPMLCARWLRPGHDGEHSKLYQVTERAWTVLLEKYRRSLGWVMDHRRAAIAFSILTLFGTAWLAIIVPKGFIPSEDTGQLSGNTQAAEGTSFEAMIKYQQQASDIVAADPDIDGFMSALGGGGGGRNINEGRLFINLKPRNQRKRSADEIARDLSRKLAGIPGLRSFISNPPTISLGGRSTRSTYQYTLRSGDIDLLYKSAQALEGKLKQLALVRDVSTDLSLSNPQVQVSINRERASALGVSAEQIQTALYNAYGARQVSTIYTPSNQYIVVLELLPQYQKDLTALNLLSITAPNGELVPLTSVATVSPSRGPLAVNHTGQQPSVTISFDLAQGVSLGAAVAEVEKIAAAVVPGTVQTSFGGTAQAFEAAQGNLLALLIVAILVIYIVLGILYESFIHPITILTGLPFAGFGALLFLVLFREELSIYAFVGIIMLVGLVKKNAIMMIDFALEAERKEGKNPHDAIVEACLVRFRPIMMTTMAALMGTLPIALGHGAGAESRRPLGVAVVGGLAFSQVVTLYVTPVFYTYLDQFQKWLEHRRTSRRPVLTDAPAGLP